MSDYAHPAVVRGANDAPFASRLKQYIRWIIAFSFLGFLVGVVVLLVVPARYEAIAVVAPPIDHSGAKIRGDVGVSSGSGLLAGLSLGGGSAAPPLIQRFQQTLGSRKLADLLFQNEKLVHTVFATQWDEQNHVWLQPTGLMASIRGFVLGILHRPQLSAPTAWHLQRFLEQNIVVTQVPRSSGMQIKYVCREPDICLDLLRTIISQADGIIRKDVIAHDDSYVSFISTRLQTVTDIANRQVLIDLLTDISRDQMLASSGENYSMDVIDDPAVSALPTEPKIGLTLALGLLAGLMLSVIGAVVYEAIGVGIATRHQGH